MSHSGGEGQGWVCVCVRDRSHGCPKGGCEECLKIGRCKCCRVDMSFFFPTEAKHRCRQLSGTPCISIPRPCPNTETSPLVNRRRR